MCQLNQHFVNLQSFTDALVFEWQARGLRIRCLLTGTVFGALPVGNPATDSITTELQIHSPLWFCDARWGIVLSCLEYHYFINFIILFLKVQSEHSRFSLKMFLLRHDFFGRREHSRCWEGICSTLNLEWQLCNHFYLDQCFPIVGHTANLIEN